MADTTTGEVNAEEGDVGGIPLEIGIFNLLWAKLFGRGKQYSSTENSVSEAGNQPASVTILNENIRRLSDG